MEGKNKEPRHRVTTGPADILPALTRRSLVRLLLSRVRWVDDADRATLEIEIEIEARKNGRPICSGCGQHRPGYDRLPERHFEYVPLWGIAVYFVYAMRRVKCPTCGVKVEQVPWCDGKNQLTTTYRWFLAGCCGPEKSARRRRFLGSSACWAKIARPGWVLCAATCGSRT